MTPTRRFPAALTRIAVDARVRACIGRGRSLAGMHRVAAFYSGLLRAA